jgi:hypothetical protein
MPAEDMYSDGSAPEASAPAGDSKESSGDNTAKTALLPKSLLGPDLKAGHKCEVEIVADHGDDYEVKYSTEGQEPSAPEKGADSDMPQEGAGGGMESMLQD